MLSANVALGSDTGCMLARGHSGMEHYSATEMTRDLGGLEVRNDPEFLQVYVSCITLPTVTAVN